MAAHKYTSWGRTRRPKPAGGEELSYITGSGIASDSAAAGLPALTGIGAEGSPSVGVYKTENQRYAHLHCSGSNSGISNVFVYTHASNSWAELKTVDPTDGSRNTIAVSANEHIIVDINGADLIAFVTGSSTKLPYQNFVAFSTF
tara:strand:+ start:432 stop:866 length:435 start_codon:yes stop_codon:yes gene_type:complete